MSHVTPLSREDLPELADTLQEYEERLGFLPNSMLIMARIPALLQGFNQLAAPLYGPDAKVPRPIRALVAHMASRTAGCQYCVAHTTSTGHDVGLEDRKIAAIWDYERSPLFSEAERAALRFAQTAAAVPNVTTAEEFAELRKHFDERQIVELVAIVAFMGFLNRWNDTLATSLEDVPRARAESALGEGGWRPGKHAADVA